MPLVQITGFYEFSVFEWLFGDWTQLIESTTKVSDSHEWFVLCLYGCSQWYPTKLEYIAQWLQLAARRRSVRLSTTATGWSRISPTRSVWTAWLLAETTGAMAGRASDVSAVYRSSVKTVSWFDHQYKQRLLIYTVIRKKWSEILLCLFKKYCLLSAFFTETIAI